MYINLGVSGANTTHRLNVNKYIMPHDMICITSPRVVQNDYIYSMLTCMCLINYAIKSSNIASNSSLANGMLSTSVPKASFLLVIIW